MKLHVRIGVMEGGAMSFEIDVKKTCTIENLRHKIFCQSGVPPEKQTLICCGTKLLDGRRVDDYGITEGSNVIVVLK